MIIIEAEILTSVGGFSKDSGGQFPDAQIIQKKESHSLTRSV
jgi:hypothetical protein